MSLLLIIGTGCDLTPPTTDTPDVDPIRNGADLPLSFTGMPAGSELSDKIAKSGDEISPYGCFLNAYHPGESEPYRYWSVYLHYPEPIAEEAGDRKAVYKYRLKDASDKVYLLANCVIPATQNAVNLVDRLLRESLSEYETSSTVAKSNLAPQPVNSTDDLCSQSNDEGFSCREGSCWLNDDMNSCCGFNPLGEYECGLPELEEVAEIEDCLGDDCGGGSGVPWPIPPAPPEDPSDPNPWEPIIPGGSSDPCETCDPGEDPDDDEQLCPLGQIDDGFGNCIEEEGDPEPCETDDEIIDDPNVHSEFQNIWDSTNFGNEFNPNPLDQRKETASWIVQTSTGFKAVPFNEDFIERQDACAIDYYGPVPENVVGLIHTHPYSVGTDLSTICELKPGDDPIYRGEPSDADYGQALNNATTFGENFQNYVLDADGISSYNLLQAVTETQSRYEPCGFEL